MQSGAVEPGESAGSIVFVTDMPAGSELENVKVVVRYHPDHRDDVVAGASEARWPLGFLPTGAVARPLRSGKAGQGAGELLRATAVVLAPVVLVILVFLLLA
ncbi:hypothetical protein [uncultured Corynebacterium sp.]|uniref:hypothetical protein n=1 Tax=uncultured Corynebacterium sp. TaxID=159447 RepID=UPI0025F305F4|nr:hypothetical protein [uncultured Corynebacterium sp.]